MNIKEMEAGREMDALVAEKVMGWKECKRGWDTEGKGHEIRMWTPDGELLPVLYLAKDMWNPSTDIAAAWLVEERIAELELIDEYCFHLNAIANEYLDKIRYMIHRPPVRWQLIHATPEDRCRAALMAVEKD
jgi:hypothetical protein